MSFVWNYQARTAKKGHFIWHVYFLMERDVMFLLNTAMGSIFGGSCLYFGFVAHNFHAERMHGCSGTAVEMLWTFSASYIPPAPALSPVSASGGRCLFSAAGIYSGTVQCSALGRSAGDAQQHTQPAPAQRPPLQLFLTIPVL